MRNDRDGEYQDSQAKTSKPNGAQKRSGDDQKTAAAQHALT
jgi:hypothetical protein